MKISGITFAVLTTIFLFSSLAIFTAGSFIFLITQLYSNIFETLGSLSAILITIPAILLICGVLFFITKIIFFRSFIQKENPQRIFKKSELVKKIIISLAAYKILQLLHLVKGKKQPA